MLKHNFAVLVLLVALAATFLLATNASVPARANSTLTTEADKNLKDAHGTVLKFEETFLIEGIDGQRYVPTNLPKKYQHAGQLVEFSGTLLPLPEGVKAIGRPINLTAIKQINQL